MFKNGSETLVQEDEEVEVATCLEVSLQHDGILTHALDEHDPETELPVDEIVDLLTLSWRHVGSVQDGDIVALLPQPLGRVFQGLPETLLANSPCRQVVGPEHLVGIVLGHVLASVFADVVY